MDNPNKGVTPMPNEPFDYDRLDALLREFGYEDPEKAAAPQLPPEPQQTAASRTQAAAQTAPSPNRQVQPAAQPYVQPQPQPAPQPPKKKKKKKHRFLKTCLILILLLVLLAAVAVGVLLFSDAAQPKSDEVFGARKTGCSTILLAGTDAGGTRTDTIMLCTINTSDGSISLLSIPRDTLVNDSYSVPKINGTYGVYGSGEDGMEALMDAVQNLIGFRPDGYALVDLDAFVEIVDLMGGVEFDVPVDMYYNDPAQDLVIDLDEGLQTLNGEQAMGLVRFRSGYALADLQRVNVQRDFIATCMDQWVTPSLALKAGDLIDVVTRSVTTDLSAANLAWCAGAILRCDTTQIETNTLPGYATMWNGGSYYAVYPYDTIELVNELYNPYRVDVTIYDLDIRTP